MVIVTKSIIVVMFLGGNRPLVSNTVRLQEVCVCD